MFTESLLTAEDVVSSLPLWQEDMISGAQAVSVDQEGHGEDCGIARPK